jgi:hypothetical protein
MDITEGIGYLAMILTMLSFVFEKMIWLRTTNLSACIAFVIYGILIHSMPVIATNVIIGIIQINWLIKHHRASDKEIEF